MKERVMEEVRRMFKPEFLNRIDEILVFHPLTKENIKTIAGILLRGIKKRTEDQLGMTLTITDDAIDFLADKGYDSKYGARPLRRTIQTQIEDQLSEKILDLEYDEELDYKIVGSTEANSLKGKISNESPVGKALIGAKIGDIVEVETQAGVIKYKVLEIERSN